MNSKSRHLTRLFGLVTTILGTLVFTASRAAAVLPGPAPAAPKGGPEGSGTQPVLRISENSVSVLQWVIFTLVVVAALLIGAALTNLAQRRRTQMAH